MSTIAEDDAARVRLDTAASERQARVDENERANVLRNKAQEARAVDENDPRVIPHLQTAANTVAYSADAVAQRDAALAETRDKMTESQAKVEAALGNLNAAQEVLEAARAEHSRNIIAFTALDGSVANVPPAQHLAPGEETALMFFPRQVMINGAGTTATFPPGVHPVPISLQSHWWLEANGVRPFKGTLPAADASFADVSRADTSVANNPVGAQAQRGREERMQGDRYPQGNRYPPDGVSGVMANRPYDPSGPNPGVVYDSAGQPVVEPRVVT